MILRRVIAHVKEQAWTAIAIDLVIVVVGVFIGIQVSNWNEERGAHEREHLLLVDLRVEIAQSVRQTLIKQRAFEQINRSGTRAVAFLDAGRPCNDQCWSVIVDFFHASQWQAIIVGLPTYDEMRRNGWPRQRKVVDAVEAYLRQAEQIAVPLQQPPAYRARVRGLIPLSIHAPYWATCFELSNGEEAYVEDCPQGVAPAISAAGVTAIMQDPEIHRELTEWTGFTAGMIASFAGKNEAAEHALTLIDAELADAR